MLRRVAPAVLVALATLISVAADAAPPADASPSVLVVGSVNVDIIIPVGRLPSRGETLTARAPAHSTALGGKGANQAVAAARLARPGAGAALLCQFGNDSHAVELEAALAREGVDVSACGRAGLPSGQGVVMLEPDGTASSVVLAGSNAAFPQEAPAALGRLLRGAGAVLLQQEVPEHVNEAAAAAAAAAGVPVLLDAGGEDRMPSSKLLRLVDFLSPNESELSRLTGLPTGTDEAAAAAAAALLARGARAVLATLGERGALLLLANGTVLRQPPLPVPGGVVVDATAAGDAFRAAFAVGVTEGWTLAECLRLAAAAGAVAASRMGAAPSLPSRAEAEALAASESGAAGAAGAGASASDAGAPDAAAVEGRGSCGAGAGPPPPCLAPSPRLTPVACPLEFASRLNSMSARRDLAAPADGGDDVLGWISRQARVRGLSLVNLNHPEHTAGHTPAGLRAALRAAGLRAGAVNLRFSGERFRRGALSSPEPGAREAAAALAAEGCRWAAELGARDVMDYVAAWRRAVEGFRRWADACPPGVRVSLEFKPTDESTRHAVVPTTGAALLLAREVDRPSFGLTLDLGHLLAAGENPAQSVALAAAVGKLFGLHLNDAHVKLGAEDGLAFASVNPLGALELVRWLQRSGYDGHIYFDTFPRKASGLRGRKERRGRGAAVHWDASARAATAAGGRRVGRGRGRPLRAPSLCAPHALRHSPCTTWTKQEDPVREAELNVRRFKALWARAARLAAVGIDRFAESHDALGALELLEAEEGVEEGRGAERAAHASAADVRNSVKARGWVWHHGIVVSAGAGASAEVVSHSPWTGVVQEPLEQFSGGGPVVKVAHAPGALPYAPEEVAVRAAAAVGATDYHLLFWNCESFATWCCTGRAASAQVSRAGHAALAAAAALGMLPGLAVVVPASFALFAAGFLMVDAGGLADLKSLHSLPTVQEMQGHFVDTLGSVEQIASLLSTAAEGLRDRFCSLNNTADVVIPGSKLPTMLFGPSVEIRLKGPSCNLTSHGNLTCASHSLSVARTPAKLVGKHHSAEAFWEGSCIAGKKFGEETTEVLYNGYGKEGKDGGHVHFASLDAFAAALQRDGSALWGLPDLRVAGGAAAAGGAQAGGPSGGAAAATQGLAGLLRAAGWQVTEGSVEV
eukprot:scaffold11.g4048.t1